MQWVLIARSLAAVQSQYSQFTGHCAPRARRPLPRSHPCRRRRSPGSRPGSVGWGRGRGRSGRRAAEPGSGGERACSLPRLPALLVSAAPRVESNSRSSHSLQTQPLLRQIGVASRTRRWGQQPASLNSDSAPAAGKPVPRQRRKNTRQVAPGTEPRRPRALRSGPRPGAPRAPRSSSSHLPRCPESPSLLTPESCFSLFFS